MDHYKYQRADLSKQLAGALEMRLKRLAPAQPQAGRVFSCLFEEFPPRRGKGEKASMTKRRTLTLTNRPAGARAAETWARAEQWAKPGAEPSLSEILADPLIHLLFRRDHISARHVRAVIEHARAKRAVEPSCRKAA